MPVPPIQLRPGSKVPSNPSRLTSIPARRIRNIAKLMANAPTMPPRIALDTFMLTSNFCRLAYSCGTPGASGTACHSLRIVEDDAECVPLARRTRLTPWRRLTR